MSAFPAGLLMFGNTPVPKTAAWSAEEGYFLARCAYFHRIAICMAEAQGQGQPSFSKPHMVRQRRAVALCLCDLCGRSMRMTTKVSLSHARPQPHGADGWAVLQVEPMLHVACAAISARYCPALKRDICQGTIAIRTVTRWRAQCAFIDPKKVEQDMGRYVKPLGHAKVELQQWKDRDLAWLEQQAERT